jgi:hypothetical protein
MKRRSENEYITIRVPRKFYNRKLKSILSEFEHVEIVSKSKATEKEIKKFLSDVGEERGKLVSAMLKERGIILE